MKLFPLAFLFPLALLFTLVTASCGDAPRSPVDASVPCVRGAPCDTGTPCVTGRTYCTGETAMCVPNFASLPPTTSCGASGTCGPAGVCSECLQGSACDPGRPCVQGVLDCSGGSPVCNIIALFPTYVDCGGGQTCDGAGVCPSCPAGFEPNGAAGCRDLNECMRTTDDCGPMSTCGNVDGSFTCTCVSGWVGSGHGPGGCLWDDATLSALEVGVGARLSPVFDSHTTVYALTLPPGELSTTLTPSVADATRATIRVDGAVVASGGSATSTVRDFTPGVVNIRVTAESGQGSAYGLSVTRSSLYVKASNTFTSNNFGSSVAVSADGTRLAIGAPGERSRATGIGGDEADTTALDAGAVYVFARVGANWAQESYIKASNTHQGDSFGSVVALSADGARLAVSAPREQNGGLVYVFSRSASGWVEDTRFRGSNTEWSDAFGQALSLSGDGLRLAAGAPNEWSDATGVNGNQTRNSFPQSGAVYVFSLTGGVWTQEAYVKASNTEREDLFGSAVSLSGDGGRLAVGAYHEDSSATGIDGDQADYWARDSGAAYLFARVDTTWSQEAYVKASNTGGASSVPSQPGDEFGFAVALSSDGLRLAVGAPSEDSAARGVGGDETDNSLGGSGAVYVFAFSGGAWAQEAYTKASNAGAGHGFGSSVALSADGAALAVGAPRESYGARGLDGRPPATGIASSGAAYLLSRLGTRWAQLAYAKASNPGALDTFGAAVSLTGSGNRLLVGAPLEGSRARGIGGDEVNDLAPTSGAVYYF